MPAQKHKKKKKSYKQTKKYASLNLESYVLGLQKKFLNSDSDDSMENEDELTQLVRRSYVNHLQQELLKNFKCCSEIAEFSSSLQEMAQSWSSVLENKALEASTISELYRKNMVSLIKYITVATNSKKLCIKGKHISKLSSKLLLHKETQTESMEINNYESRNLTWSGSKTNSISVGSILNTLTPNPCDSPCGVSLFNISSETFNTNISNNQQLESSTNQDVISSTSDFFDPLLHNYFKSTELTNSFEILNQSNKVLNYKISGNQSSNEKLLSELDDAVVSVSGASEHLQGCDRPTIEQSRGNHSDKDCLDKRLQDMGVLNESEDETNIQQSHLITCKKSNWYAEEVAQSCNLTRILLGMSTYQREKVLTKIKSLFGDDAELLSELTEKNIAICRRRIASIVVMELTPIYQAKKIASRQLFKLLAKEITKNILSQSYAPDTKSIKQKVREFFRDGKMITSELDCCC